MLYFLLVDRFSDGKEDGYRDATGQLVTGTTPVFQAADDGNAVQTDSDAAAWRDAGGGFVGGNLEGLRSKLGYLKRLGVTAVWVSPVLKQAVTANSYHGYAIQDFLEVDPHFGTPEEFRSFVAEAHALGIRVVLDIILNHTGDVFAYRPDRYPRGGTAPLDPRWDGAPYEVMGFRDARGNPTLPFGPVDLDAHPDAYPDGAVWPAELQAAGVFTTRGHIQNWDYYPEFVEGDFDVLRDVYHGERALDADGAENPAAYRPSPALRALCHIYQYWLAYLDLDGYRVDTVKHMDLGATRFFSSVMHEFAESLGKDNFYLIGEITGGRDRAFTTREVTGLDAALGIDDLQDDLEYIAKGYKNPSDYFDLFRNSPDLDRGGHRWFRDKVVTQIDDHDQIRKGNAKARFCAGGGENPRLLVPALALNLLTLGIPCLYYGEEQLFDGQGDNDRYIREAMFGGQFGAFRSKGRHFFREDAGIYARVAELLALRRAEPALRRGRQYLRPISGDGASFGFPTVLGGRMRSVVPWSRLFNDRELVVAINTDPDQPRGAWVTIDDFLHATGDRLTCLYSTDASEVGRTVSVEARNGKAVWVTVPAAGVVVYG